MATTTRRQGTLIQSISLFKTAFLHNLQRSVLLRVDFAIDLCITVFKHTFFLINWYFFFDKYKVASGWDFKDLLLTYGLLSVGIGVVEVFFYGVKVLPEMIEKGQLDSYIIQPQNLLLHIAVSRGKLSSLGDILTGILALTYGRFFIDHLVGTLLCIPLAILFVLALYLYLSCLSFYMKNASELVRALYRNAIILASQPNASYTGILKWLTFTVLPVGLLSFLPAAFMKSAHYSHLIMAYLGTAAFLTVSCVLFYRGIERYESGSLFTTKL